MTTDLERAPLYAVSDAYRQIAELLAAEFDPDNPDQSAAVMATLDEIGGLLRHKVESIAGLIRDLDRQADSAETDAAWVAQEAKRLAGRAAARRARADWLRGYALRELENAGLDRVETDRFTVRIALNPPKCDVINELVVPPSFLRHIPAETIPERWEVNKVAVNANYTKTGEIPPGCSITRGKKLVVS